ncbi:MAG TPA: Holliday junction resolvase RuvX [Gemmatimonadaceae bacterium]|nr:Holliday junction resolvase RuvX [Gemmatimonadaceae bacterium]
MAEEGGRLLGVDLGERRIGLAVGDPTGTIASALRVLPSLSRARDVAAVSQIAREEGARTVVVGMPVSMNGTYGPQAEKARRFGAALEAAGVLVVYWDERLTTVEAARYLRDSGMRREKRARTIDAAAAALLLQNYLDYLRNR